MGAKVCRTGFTMRASPRGEGSAPTLFVGGRGGAWRVDRLEAVVGAPLPAVASLDIIEGPYPEPRALGAWSLRGLVEPDHYTTPAERDLLATNSPPLDRPEAGRAALIPVRKSRRWWSLDPSARRAIFEERSRHIATGREYLPAVARRLYHSRDLGEPFDFLTWFEYAPSDAAAFETLVRRLRATPEWSFVDREVDVRLSRRT